MASPINTGGFTVQERPRVDYVDPRLMVAQSSAILPAVQQGMKFGSGIQQDFLQIQDEALERPIKRRLQQIQLEEAQARMAQLPIEQQLRALQLGEAQQQAAIPQQIIEQVEVVGGEPRTSVANLDAGFGNLEFVEEFAPRERITRGQSVAAGGVKSPFEKRETLLTGAQVRAENEKAKAAIESAKALANQRNRGKEFEVSALAQLIEDAKAEGDDEKAAIYEARLNKLNTVRPVLTATDVYDRRIAQQIADSGIAMPVAKRLLATPQGAEILARAAAAKKTAISAAYAPIKLSKSELAAIAAAEADVASEALPPSSQSPAPAAIFNTIAEAEAARASGLISDGSKIVVGGKPATWRD